MYLTLTYINLLLRCPAQLGVLDSNFVALVGANVYTGSKDSGCRAHWADTYHCEVFSLLVVGQKHPSEAELCPKKVEKRSEGLHIQQPGMLKVHHLARQLLASRQT